MPLITSAYLAFCAGLLAAFGGAAGAVLCLATAGAALGALRRDARVCALALAAAAGALLALDATRRDERCAERLTAASIAHVVIEADAAPGAFVRGRLREPGCTGIASVTVAGGRARAGDEVAARGDVAPIARGVRVRDAEVTATGRASELVRLRARAAAAIDELFPRDAALVRALLVADASGIEPAVRDRYADAGLVHLLSVSGLHVAIIFAAMQLLAEAARVPRRAASIAALAATGLYVLMIGAPAPAVRSGVMLGVGAISRLAQRPTSPWAALALGAFAPLVNPRTAVDVGYQLSVAGMAALIAGGRLAERLCGDRVAGWRRRVAVELVVSVVASVVTAPMVAWTFGRVSLVGPLANLVAGPIVALAQPMLFLALLCAPVRPLGAFVAAAVHPLLAMLDAIAASAAAVPHAALRVTPTFASAALCACAVAAVLVACVVRAPARASIVAVACVALVAWMPLLPAGRSREMELHMIDVGQGDALAVRTPRGRWLLFDAGRTWRGGDMGRRAVIPYLRRRGGRVEAFVLSHPHADHVGGASAVIAALRPGRFFDPGFALGSDVYDATLRTARDAGVAWRRVQPGDSLALDGVTVRFLAPDSAWTAGLRDANLASTVARVEFGRVRFLLVGDAEAAEERWLLARDPAQLRADVLKVAHHGSATSTTPEFLAAVAPRVALVSVGADNTYGHPDMDVMRALRDAGAEVLRTDQLGAVVVRTDGRALSVEARGARWRVPEAARP